MSANNNHSRITRIKPVYDMQVLGSNLRRLREEHGFSVEDVRAYLELSSVQSVYQYENGIAMPRADALLALMELYGITPAELRNTVCIKKK